MNYDANKKEIVCNKKLNSLDKFVLDFVNLLENYVIVSGYVSILLGRSRATEDVDLLVPHIDKEDFESLWVRVQEKNFWCINTSSVNEAFDMLKGHAVRFARKGEPIPNIEFKIIKTDLDKYSYENKIRVILGNDNIFISPLEMQIAYKLFLAADGIDEELESDKDIEDAKHLYKVFEEKINKDELLVLVSKLNVKNKLKLLK